MNKQYKVVVALLIAIAAGFLVNFIFRTGKYQYDVEMDDYTPYLNIFKDSIRPDIDANIFVGYVRKTDAVYYYRYKPGLHYTHKLLYKGSYNITIWDLKNLDMAKLENMHIHQNVNLDNVFFKSGEKLNSKSNPTTTVRFGPFLYGKMDVNIDRKSIVGKGIIGSNYKGFWGVVNKLSFSNENSENVVLIDYSSKNEPVIFLLYKGPKSMYAIIISSDNPFDENIIKILNLN